MKKAYYEVLEYKQQVLKNMYYFWYVDVLESKNSAEDCYRIKIKMLKEDLKKFSMVNYQMVLAIITNHKVEKHVLSDPGTHLLESLVLSELTGSTIIIPEWPIREAEILNAY